MKKLTRRVLEQNPALAQEFHHRLVELEAELIRHASRIPGKQLLDEVEDLKDAHIGSEKVIQFSIGNKKYAAGHADVTYSGSNHARGVRHIHLYEAGKMVLEVEGDFEDQQFGCNFRFQTLDVYVPGPWEADFIKVTDALRKGVAKRKSAFKKKRAAEWSRR